MIGGAALGIWMDIEPAGLEDFNAWYPRQHLPERLSVPGFRRGRRYAATGAGPGFFTLYETGGPEVLSSAAYLERLNHPTDWTRRVLPRFRRMVRNAYRVVAASPADPEAPWIFTARVAPGGESGPVRDALAGQGLARVTALPGVAAAAVLETETGGTSVVTTERRLVGGEVVAAPPLLVLVEVTEAGAEAGLRRFWAEWAGAAGAEVTGELYRLLYGLRWLGDPDRVGRA